MSTDGPPRDDKFLAELAAFDELLRKPLEPEPLKAPPAPTPAPSPTPARGPAAARAPAPAPAAPQPARAPAIPQPDARLRKSAEPVSPALEPVQPKLEPVRTPPVPPPQVPLAPVESLPVDEWLAEPDDIEPPSRNIEALIAAETRQASRRSRPSALAIAALSAGILAGGPLGWWLAVNLFVSTPPPELVELEPSARVPAATPPAAPRSATRRASSKAAGATATPTAASHTASNAAAATRTDIVSSPPAASAAAGIATVESIPIVPAPSMDLPLTTAPPPAPPSATPLTAAPLPGAPSVLPSAPTSLAAAASLAAATSDRAAIERTLRQYKDAYERLDAKAAMEVWPTVDQRALSRAFAGLMSQSLDFRGCEVAVRPGASTATASCNGTAEYVRKVGDTRVRVEPRQWTFTLNKTQGAWRIEAVDGSR